MINLKDYILDRIAISCTNFQPSLTAMRLFGSSTSYDNIEYVYIYKDNKRVGSLKLYFEVDTFKITLDKGQLGMFKGKSYTGQYADLTALDGVAQWLIKEAVSENIDKAKLKEKR